MTRHQAEDYDDEVDPPKLSRPVGRPPKNYVDLHVQVAIPVKEKIEVLAKVLECSQGEVVGAALRAYLESFKP